MTDFLQTLITSMSVGSLYALIALGYTMVYGILKFINFAHSDIVVLGAWVSFKLATKGLPHVGVDPQNAPWYAGGIVLLLAMIFCGCVGFVIERLAYKPLRRAPRLNVLITAIGVSLLLQNVGQLDYVFGTQPERMPSLLPNTDVVNVALASDEGEGQRLVIGLVDVATFVTAAVLMMALEFLVYRTKIGIGMRAISYNTDVASLMGVNVNALVSFTFVLGSMLAAAAGFLWVMKYPLQQPANSAWVLLGLKAFVAAVLGGIGNVRGAVAGGFLIAFIEQFGAFYISADLRDVYVFAILIVVLLFKPAGLFGKSVSEKV